jgi:hypothetical protein
VVQRDLVRIDNDNVACGHPIAEHCRNRRFAVDAIADYDDYVMNFRISGVGH